ncbi:hypothetical protein LOTGIDRAFT_175937 [Lottia gigantea]|uniref:Uncharacterized protein n=1 Tax=Lottia gigantea TaxID=225164 RepID=V3Z9N4_LOTGI|nr:hypothetical protein LOTGIDRAFT_175937 [Lottia gigantea]ESO87643.1 hypothetical protein LOTGIDRAFT_175937 [Lottia gigantea]
MTKTDFELKRYADDRIEECSISQNEVSDIVTEKCTQMDETNNTIETLKNKIINLEDNMNELAQYSRKSHIRIFGVPESEGEVEIAQDIFRNKLNIQFDLIIDAAHRVGRFNTPDLSNPGVTIRPRGIIVRLLRRDLKQAIITARRKLAVSSISICEDMTLTNVKLLKETQT